MGGQPIVLFRKLSKLEWDARRYNEPLEAMPALYKAQGLDVAAIVESHYRQIATFERITALLKQHHNLTPPIVDSWSFIGGDPVAISLLKQAELVIASVGDELATSVARVLENSRLIPINADPLTSEGALLWPSVDVFEKHIGEVLTGLPHSYWPRIRVQFNGQLIGDAIGDVFVGAKERLHVSHYSIQSTGDKLERQNSSGVVVTTGAGSTGWYRSAYWDTLRSEAFLPTTNISFVVSEPYRGKLSSYSLIEGELQNGESLLLRSLMPDGIIVLDNRTTLRFDRQSETIMTASDQTIEVVSGDFKGRATHEVFVGNKFRQWISRYILSNRCDHLEHQKSSGLIIATPKGAPKWLIPAKSSLSIGPNEKAIFSRTEKLIKFIVTEPINKEYSNLRGTINPSNSLRIISHMPEGGIISLDSYSNYLFPSGASVELSISPRPFMVILPPS
jgi:NAD kinase